LRVNDSFRNGFVDRYGSELELAEVLRYWPSRGQQWFDAFHQAPGQRRRRSGSAGRAKGSRT